MIPTRNTKMLEGKGKFINRRTRTANKDYDKFFIYVPVEVARDGLFPFKHGDILMIKVDRDGKRVNVEKVKKGKSSSH